MEPQDLTDIFEPREIESGLTEAQASAIGHLSVNFNMLEACLEHAIHFIVDPRQMLEISALIGRMGFLDKVERLKSLGEIIEKEMREPRIWSKLSEQERTWAERDFANRQKIVSKLKEANGFRNSLVHCRVTNNELKSPRGEVTSDADTIAMEARRVGGLAISTVRFGQRFYHTIIGYHRIRDAQYIGLVKDL